MSLEKLLLLFTRSNEHNVINVLCNESVWYLVEGKEIKITASETVAQDLVVKILTW